MAYEYIARAIQKGGGSERALSHIEHLAFQWMVLPSRIEFPMLLALQRMLFMWSPCIRCRQVCGDFQCLHKSTVFLMCVLTFVQVIVEGREPDDFWSHFVNG
jgi:cytidine deaminase